MRVELVSENESDAGGYKEIVSSVKGDSPYRYFKYESGVHRVQRVPATEAQGRIHTSTATVAVLPEVDADVEIEIKPSDLQIDTYKASGAGGQYVNKTESAIRITHVPSGIVVASQQQRSQMQNREKAMQMLRAMLYERQQREKEEAMGSLRRSQVGTGDRSEKIRTYNFPQDRVTDHRINQSYGNIRGIMDGALTPIVDDLLADEQARLLAGEAAPRSCVILQGSSERGSGARIVLRVRPVDVAANGLHEGNRYQADSVAERGVLVVSGKRCVRTACCASLAQTTCVADARPSLQNVRSSTCRPAFRDYTEARYSPGLQAYRW